MLVGMSKANREDKKARREREKAEQEEDRAANELRRKRWRAVLIGIPAVAVSGSAVLHFALDESQLAGAILLAGALLWLMVGLFFLGSAIQPKQRTRASALDYGNQGRGPR
jgi:cation transport ATPase